MYNEMLNAREEQESAEFEQNITELQKFDKGTIGNNEEGEFTTAVLACCFRRTKLRADNCHSRFWSPVSFCRYWPYICPAFRFPQFLSGAVALTMTRLLVRSGLGFGSTFCEKSTTQIQHYKRRL